ncbi:VOC family protein [Kordiimonas marina]|uniref:VOC family protein n=1 Tax=Kordiimonas marina TaxID=2872312 RepID=UPI001FF14C75|nr:VOC family protein [Kordiimonas marina]MCJ9427623.1 VOC family protein [Kordiimonas marina]
MAAEDKITPFLWFDDNAEEAINFYLGTFKDSRIVSTSRKGGDDGPLFGATFELAGRRFMALNGGPHFKFNEAVSLYIECEDQEEVDTLWARLCDGGAPGQCGWLKDRFGLSWQVVPKALPRLLGEKDPARAGRVMAAMMKMQKIDIKALEQA